MYFIQAFYSKHKWGLFLVFLFFCSFNLSAQYLPSLFSGIVTDSTTQKPLPMVHLYLKSTGAGVVTDLEGKYILRVPALPDTMIISCIGYETKRIRLSLSIKAKQNISLSPKIMTLKEVTITSEKAVPFFKDEHYSVLDYALDGMNVYLLIYRNTLSRSELLLLNQQGDTIARKTDLPGLPNFLFKDCLDCIHLVTNDAAWQIIYAGDSLDLRYKTDLQRFIGTMGNCVTSVGEKLIFKRYFNYKLSVEYYALDLNSHARTTIAFVEDEYKLNMFRRNPDDRRNMELASGSKEFQREFMEDITGDLSNREVLDALHHSIDQSRFTGSVYYTPVMASLKRMDETLIIVDFSNSKMRFFDPQGKQFYEVGITFHLKNKELGAFENLFKSKKWDEYEIFVDEQKYRTYFLQTDGGRYELNEINMFTGKVSQTIRLEHSFPEKITVSDGYAYYLYKSFGDWSKKRLYRQRLD
ncbi:MAG: carboxypeptidase-like regulatory domain-containing protein [Bacteroidetes bacterium]|nr:carboxypeptidase-like regulatory domain-containing protein [Bacteroidota bacterium]